VGQNQHQEQMQASTLDQYEINTWSTKSYGFGIASSTLQYSESSQGNHGSLIMEIVVLQIQMGLST
jgi:hypothetical protein